MSRFEQFIKHRQYLMSVTDNTIRWHRCALKWLPNENPMQEQLQQMVIRMREQGLKETGWNAVIRSVKAYLHWNSGIEGKCGSACTHPKLHALREPKVVMPTFTEDQVRTLLKYRPKTDFQRRLHLLITRPSLRLHRLRGRCKNSGSAKACTEFFFDFMGEMAEPQLKEPSSYCGFVEGSVAGEIIACVVLLEAAAPAAAAFAAPFPGVTGSGGIFVLSTT